MAVFCNKPRTQKYETKSTEKYFWKYNLLPDNDYQSGWIIYGAKEYYYKISPSETEMQTTELISIWVFKLVIS